MNLRSADVSVPPLPPPPVEVLEPFERRAFRLMEFLEQRMRGPTERYLRSFGTAWMHLMVSNLVVTHGLERLAGVRPDQSILLVANHRTYFDLYTLSLMLHRHTPLHQPVYCPVRADFFYERPLGVLVNLFVGAGHMYPPVFRQPSKADFNKWALAQMVQRLKRGNILIGFHPEGTRNKNADFYQPLPAQPGVGKLVMETWPVIIPAFLSGISNDLVATARHNWSRDGGGRIYAVYGAPVDTTQWRGLSNRLATHKRIADRLLEMVYDLGEEERRLRAAAK